MLDNRKPGELPELSNKMVKVSRLSDPVEASDSTKMRIKYVSCVCLKSIVRVVFHDRRLQYTEHQQLEGWKWNRPGDRLLDIGTVCWLNVSSGCHVGCSGQ